MLSARNRGSRVASAWRMLWITFAACERPTRRSTLLVAQHRDQKIAALGLQVRVAGAIALHGQAQRHEAHRLHEVHASFLERALHTAVLVHVLAYEAQTANRLEPDPAVFLALHAIEQDVGDLRRAEAGDAARQVRAQAARQRDVLGSLLQCE
jgi:Co/Zn/Cd efflux system component